MTRPVALRALEASQRRDLKDMIHRHRQERRDLEARHAEALAAVPEPEVVEVSQHDRRQALGTLAQMAPYDRVMTSMYQKIPLSAADLAWWHSRNRATQDDMTRRALEHWAALRGAG